MQDPKCCQDCGFQNCECHSLDVYDDLGYSRPMSKEQKEKVKKEYRGLMKQFRAKKIKVPTERDTVIREGRF